MAALVRVWDGPAGSSDAGTPRVLVGGRTLGLERVPGRGGAPSRTPLDEHLVAGPDEASRDVLACADVIVRAAGEPAGHRAAFPGCLVAAVNTGRGCLLAAGGWSARLVPVLGRRCTDEDASAYASAVHAWIVAGRPLGAVTHLTVVRGGAVARVRVRPAAAGAAPTARMDHRRAAL
ncbi:hypothetical protein ACQEU6_38445 [Spirillospora sp. CA-108201]